MQGILATRQRWWRIIPAAFFMYTLALMDRTNISFAIPGMEKELGMSATTAGLISGVFFLGYMFLQVPGGYLASRWSARKFITIALIAWGVFAILCGLVRNTTELVLVRFLLGVAEGGVWPATLVLLARWFPLEERARANSYWMFCIPVSSIVMAPVSGWILTWANWHTLLILEGIPPLLWAAIWWFVIVDEPEKAAWLTPEERGYLAEQFAHEQHPAAKPGDSWKDCLHNRSVWWLVCAHFFSLLGLYGVTMWLPMLIGTMTGQNPAMVGLLSALPFVAAILGLYLNANHSDRMKERKKHVAVPLLAGSGMLFLSSLTGTYSPILGMLCLILAIGFLLSAAGIFWTLPSLFLGKQAMGPGVGFINTFGHIGSFLGPVLLGYTMTRTGSSFSGIALLCVSLCISGSMLLLFRYQQPGITLTTGQPANTVSLAKAEQVQASPAQIGAESLHEDRAETVN